MKDMETKTEPDKETKCVKCGHYYYVSDLVNGHCAACIYVASPLWQAQCTDTPTVPAVVTDWTDCPRCEPGCACCAEHAALMHSQTVQALHDHDAHATRGYQCAAGAGCTARVGCAGEICARCAHDEE